LVARRLLWASLALAPITMLVDGLVHPDKTVLFVLAALSPLVGYALLSPLAERRP
jgi:hypothetical protein